MSVTGASDTEAVRSPPATDHKPDDTGAHELLLAPMWRRLAARAVDVTAVATWVFALSIAHVFLHLQLWSQSVAPDPWGTWFLATLTFAACYAAYEITFISRTGATPGKDLMRVRVIDHLTGHTPTLGQATRRWLLPGIVQPIPGPWFGATLTLVWGGTGFANHHHRGVHDHLAGTRVVMALPPRDENEEAHRRRQFTPRFVDPLAVFRIARNDPEALRRHPADHES
ncbi:MAG: RDD family protein [Acidimicrobiales bacterium]|nr:RDD family protein [Acidimicrobiales bacterium]